MKRKTGRKLLSFLLTLAMLVGLMLGMGLTAYAATYNITINKSEHGSVSAVTSAQNGANVTLTATPDAGYRLKSISVAYQVAREETLTPSSSNGTYFKVAASVNQNGWWYLNRNVFGQGTVTASCQNSGGIINKAEFNINNKFSSYNVNSLSVNPGTLASSGNTLSVTSINANSFTVNGSADGSSGCTVNSVKITGTAPAELSINSTNDPNKKTFTMPDKNVSITAVFEELPKYNVTLSGATNAVANGGSTSQTGLIGAMTPVVYTANEGYYFPENYSVEAVNGISVTRNSYTQITVFGTPTANAEITLTAPTAKTKPAAPTTAAAVDCTTAANNDGKLTGVTTAMEYKKSDATSWTAGTGNDITGLVPGIYYVRVKATDTTTASGNQELTITAYQKENAVITKTPTTKSVIYNGSAQELVTMGEATGGEMRYALGTKDAATEPYTTSIPTGTNVGTYYVWYKVVGDGDHLDTEPKCITVTISPKEEPQTEPQPQPAPASQPQQPAAVSSEDFSLIMNSDFLVFWKGSKVMVRWGTVPGADSYEVYADYCGSHSIEKVLTVPGGNSTEIPLIDGKKPNPKNCVKAYVVAYRNGVPIGKTLQGHAAGRNYNATNVKRIKASKKTYKLALGKSKKLKIKTVKMKRRKKMIEKWHCDPLRYASSDETVATVTKKGKIKAVGKGSCEIWAYAQNGRSCKVKVIVK